MKVLLCVLALLLGSAGAALSQAEFQPNLGDNKDLAEEGSVLTRRSVLNFEGEGITCVDNSTDARTDCTVPYPDASNVELDQYGGPDDSLQDVYNAGQLLWGNSYRQMSLRPQDDEEYTNWSGLMAPIGTGNDRERPMGGLIFYNSNSIIWGEENYTALWSSNGDNTVSVISPGKVDSTLRLHAVGNDGALDFSLDTALMLHFREQVGLTTAEMGASPYRVWHEGNAVSLDIETWYGRMDLDDQTLDWVGFDEIAHLGGAPHEITDNDDSTAEQFTLDPGFYTIELSITQTQTSRMCSLYVWSKVGATDTTILSAISYGTIYLGHSKKTITVAAATTAGIGVYAGSCLYASDADGEIILLISRLRE